MERLIGRLRRHWRSRRMALFLREMRPTSDCRILDIGGLPELWDILNERLDVTLLNLPEAFDRIDIASHWNGRLIAGDICRQPELAAGFDIVFSNSVLEHVGSGRRQRAFAEAIRQAPAYWLQVPAPSFPLEQHCRQWFWWLMPMRMRRRRIRGWRRDGRMWTARQMASTRPISRNRLEALFPEDRSATEWFLGLPKSHYRFRRPTNGRPQPAG